MHVGIEYALKTKLYGFKIIMFFDEIDGQSHRFIGVLAFYLHMIEPDVVLQAILPESYLQRFELFHSHQLSGCNGACSNGCFAQLSGGIFAADNLGAIILGQRKIERRHVFNELSYFRFYSELSVLLD